MLLHMVKWLSLLMFASHLYCCYIMECFVVPFYKAICYCNRAAAYQALGQVTDALADCSLAIALDPNYLKPYSRRAALFEMMRDYRQAALDLQRLLSLLKKNLEDTSSDRMSLNKCISGCP